MMFVMTDTCAIALILSQMPVGCFEQCSVVEVDCGRTRMSMETI